MTLSEHKKALLNAEKLKEKGFFLIDVDNGIIIRVENTHENWVSFGFTIDNRVSPVLKTMEEVMAWVDGFMTHRQFLNLREAE